MELMKFDRCDISSASLYPISIMLDDMDSTNCNEQQSLQCNISEVITKIITACIKTLNVKHPYNTLHMSDILFLVLLHVPYSTGFYAKFRPLRKLFIDCCKF